MTCDLSDSEEDFDRRHTSNSESAITMKTVRSMAEQLNKLELARNEQNTILQTRWATKCFTDWLLQNDIQVNFYSSVVLSVPQTVSSYLELHTGLNSLRNC